MNSIKIHDKYFKPFIGATAIDAAISQLAERINAEYKSKNPLFVGVLNGSFLFTSDLIRKIEGNCEISFIKLASYHGTESSGDVVELVGLKENIEGRDVIILEDIVDTGNTLEKIHETFLKQNPASLKIASLLFKPKAYTKQIPVDYVAIEVGNEFLVGYGLDYDGLGRNLKDIYVICD